MHYNMKTFEYYLEEARIDRLITEGNINLKNTNAPRMAEFIASVMKTSKNAFIRTDEAIKTKLRSLGLSKYIDAALKYAKEFVKDKEAEAI